MTSQKRYRHHQDNQNTRQRDLPPRFKRKKSSSMPPEPTPPSSPQKVEPLAMEGNKLLSKASTLPVAQHLYPCDVATPVKVSPSSQKFISWMPEPKELLVLSIDNQYDSNYMASSSSYTPPLSPWKSNVYNYPGSFSPFDIWSPSSTDSLGTPTKLFNPSKVIYNNENLSPHHNLIQQPSPMFNPIIPASPHLSASKPQYNLLHEQPLNFQEKAQPSLNCAAQSPNAYSDPDIRTIEMLKELERVADEKQNDDYGVDRKSLVSHHLRMLMCAVDRYTEGIEDELDKKSDKSKDESLALRKAPHAALTIQQSSQPITSRQALLKNQINKRYENSSESSLREEPKTHRIWDDLFNKVSNINDLFSFPLPCHSESELPCFDFSGSFSGSNSFKIVDKQERKPLYKR